MVTLSLIIPVYNEEKTLERCIERVLEIADEQLKLEIIIINDASRDNTAALARKLAEQYDIRLFSHDINQGKGAALRTGFKAATGDIVAIQDADLEYNPLDLKQLIAPIIEGRAEVVYGSRFLSGPERKVLFFWHSMINKFLTLCSNMCTNLYLTDMETCYKIFRRDVIQAIPTTENRFGFEPEITAKLARFRLNGQKLRIYEMPISYFGRSYKEGKKVGWKDAVRALYVIFKYAFFA